MLLIAAKVRKRIENAKFLSVYFGENRENVLFVFGPHGGENT